MSEKYTLERVYQVFDNVNGAKISVKPDIDGLGLIEVDGGDDYGRIVFDPELAGIVAHAILHCCDDIAHFQKKVEAKLAEPVRAEAPVVDDEGWIAHSGGAMPCDEDAKVEVRFRDGQTDEWRADGWHWSHSGTVGDIIAWRPAR